MIPVYLIAFDRRTPRITFIDTISLSVDLMQNLGRYLHAYSKRGGSSRLFSKRRDETNDFILASNNRVPGHIFLRAVHTNERGNIRRLLFTHLQRAIIKKKRRPAIVIVFKTSRLDFIFTRLL